MGDAVTRSAGTRTILFTDVVESTARRSRLGDLAADEVDRDHDALLRRVVMSSSGTVVKGTGDGLMAAFESASAATSCAVAIQQAVEQRSRRSHEALQVRIGLAAGDVVWERADYFGTPVIEAARLAAVARGGQILASDVVRLLAGSRAPASFTAVAPLRLKGLPQPLATCEVLWEPVATEPGSPLPDELIGADRLPLVGRVTELQRLGHMWKEVVAGSQRTVFVAGEPGVGKTRLVAELALEASRDEATVLYGRCDEDVLSPYQPFAQALEGHLGAAAADRSREVLGEHRTELARLLPSLASPAPGDEERGVATDPESNRYRFFESVERLLRHFATEHPVLFVLDDLHWADRPTALLLRHLAGASRTAPMLIVVTYRDTDVRAGHPLTDVLVDLRRGPGYERIALHGLTTDDVRELLERGAGELGDRADVLGRWLWRETEGNPLFVGEMLRHLAETGALERGRPAGGAGGPLLVPPESIREMIERRVARLAPVTQRVLRLAAVIGQQFEWQVLASAGGFHDEEELLGAIDEALQKGLLADVGGRPDHYGFTHSLVRQALYEGLSVSRRLRSHRAVGLALEALDDSHERRLSELAFHFASAAPLGEVQRAVDYARRAARLALDQTAYEAAAESFRSALELLDLHDVSDRALRCELLLDIGDAHNRAGQEPQGQPAFDEAAREATVLGRPDLLARAALGYGGDVPVATDLDDPRVLELLQEALDAVGGDPSPERALLLGRMAQWLYRRAPRERREALSHEAVETAKRTGDAATLGTALTYRYWALVGPDEVDARLAAADEIVRLGRSLGREDLLLRGEQCRIHALLELGQMDAVERAARRRTELAERTRSVYFLWSAAAYDGLLATLEGRFEEAEVLLVGARRVASGGNAEQARRTYAVQLLMLRYLQGRLHELEPAQQRLVASSATWTTAARGVLLLMVAESDRLDLAERILAEIADEGLANLHRNFDWWANVVGISVACHRLGDVRRAQALLPLVSPYATRTCTVGQSAVFGAAAHYIGLLLATCGLRDRAVEYFEDARRRHQSFRSVPLSVLTDVAEAELLSGSGRAEDVARASVLATEAARAADRLGMTVALRRARAVPQ